jgi:hypothetical protein
MAKRSGKRSAKRSAKRSTRRRVMQRGGDGYGFQGAAFNAMGPMVEVESRDSFSHCGTPARPGSLVGGARRATRRRQRGGACGNCAAPATLFGQMQSGGGGGTGGYGFNMTDNSMGKEYAALTVGACPSAAQRGGVNMMDARAIDSYSAGYSYGPESAREVGGGTAHYLDQMPYGRQCMGGGRRRRSSRRRN